MTGARARRRHQLSRGSSVLYAVVLSPVLVLVLAMATDLGVLQLDRDHLRSAVDQAVLTGADEAAGGGDGVAVDPAQAELAVRRSLVDNLRPLESAMVGTTLTAVAGSADVVVVTDVPTTDPFDASVILRRPSVVARVRVPVSTGLLHLAGVPATVVVTLTASSDLRITGRGST